VNELLFKKIVGLLSNFSSPLTYIDHHPLSSEIVQQFPPNMKLVHSVGDSASELTFYLFQSLLKIEMGRIAIYGAIGDYLDSTEGVQNLLEYWDKRKLCFQTSILIQALEAIGKNDSIKMDVLKVLSENVLPSEIDSLTELAVEASEKEEDIRKHVKENGVKFGEIGYILNSNGPLGKAAIYARAYTGTLIGLGGEVKHEKIEMSLKTGAGLDLTLS
ncbi:MAG: hypothetical protein ACUVQ8_02440, partial [Nitrososphaeria archaeon]